MLTLALAFAKSEDERHDVISVTRDVASAYATGDFLETAKLPKDFELKTESPNKHSISPSGTPDQTFNRTFTVFREAKTDLQRWPFLSLSEQYSPYAVEFEWQTNPGGAFGYGETDFFNVPGGGGLLQTLHTIRQRILIRMVQMLFSGSL